MNFTRPVAIFLFGVLLAGCSSSRREAIRNPAEEQSAGSSKDSSRGVDLQDNPPVSEVPKPVRAWKPRFLPTGSASGIMIEFKGVKKNATLRTRYAGIEVQRFASDTSAPRSLTFSASINDLRQAFFKIRPGKYVVRQVKDWADRSYFRDIEVKEGSYSILTIDVINPGAPRGSELSDTSDNK
jgi:hypothetical protein